jgi:hypothetical protein
MAAYDAVDVPQHEPFVYANPLDVLNEELLADLRKELKLGPCEAGALHLNSLVLKVAANADPFEEVDANADPDEEVDADADPDEEVDADADGMAFLYEVGTFVSGKDSPVAVIKAKTADDLTFSDFCRLKPEASDEDEDQEALMRSELEDAGLLVPPSPLKRKRSESYNSEEFLNMFGTPKHRPYTPKCGKI